MYISNLFYFGTNQRFEKSKESTVSEQYQAISYTKKPWALYIGYIALVSKQKQTKNHTKQTVKLKTLHNKCYTEEHETAGLYCSLLGQKKTHKIIANTEKHMQYLHISGITDMPQYNQHGLIHYTGL